jgi:ABC-type dipeptide/oligopeptide/nickel transport system ATPase subunit
VTYASLLTVSHLDVSLGSGLRRVEILHDVSLEIPAGHTLGLVGESGSGKSTLAKTIVGIHRASSGSISLGDVDLSVGRAHVHHRRDIQLIPQDPYSSLNPRRTIGQTIAEAIDPKRPRVTQNRNRIEELLGLVALEGDAAIRYPSEFSGGQRQRIAIARALAVQPRVIVADEITSALDLSTQAEILALLDDLKRNLGLTTLFVSHNLAVVNHLCENVMVLLHGRVVESGPAAQVLHEPSSSYTQRLIDSVPGGRNFSLS